MHDTALARGLTPPGSHSTLSDSTPLDVAPSPSSSGAVVIAPQMQQIVRVLRQLGTTTLPLLILGETGSGKEVVADWAHRFSALGARPLVKTNCAGLTDSVVESELFGHERGAFTGALQTHRGLFEAADGGTLFLDELGELPLRTQAKLLRVIETGEFCRLGSTQTRRVKVRFIAATHRDLKLRMERGDFRSDLYFRLNGVCLVVPPLRQRREEVLPLASVFLRRAAAALCRPHLQLGATACQRLLAHDWPGNVRELRNVIECAAALCRGDVIESEDLDAAAPLHADASPSLRPSHGPDECRFDAALPHEPSTSGARLRHQVLDFERARISQAIAQSHGNQTAAARLLGISRRTLTNKLNHHGLSRPRKTFT
jgi:two-component system response regulator AtoC